MEKVCSIPLQYAKYDELSSAASRQSISIAANTYGDIPPMSEQQRKLLELQYAYAQATTEIQTLKTKLKMENEEQKSRPNFTIENHGSLTFIAEQHNDIHDNHNCSIYACPPSDTSSTDPDKRQHTSDRLLVEDIESEDKAAAEASLFCLITQAAYDKGVAEDVERQLRSACVSAPKLIRCIRLNEALGYLDTQNLTSAKLHQLLNEHFGLPFKSRNFAKYRSAN